MAVFVMLPVTSILMLKAVRERWVSGWKAAAFTVAVPLAVAGMLPVLFLIGRIVP